MSTSNTTERKITVADPTPVGLFGLAMVTLVASSQKLGWTEGTALIIPWAIFLGACAQLYACVQDARKNNVFGATAFGGYGFFWLGVAMTWLIQQGVFGEKMAADADPHQLGVAFLGYLLFTLFMTVGSAVVHRVLFLIFVAIDFLFLGLTLSNFGIAPHFFHGVAAWSELVIAFLSFYGAAAAVLNHQYGRVMLPLGKPPVSVKLS